jgi:Putative adhesin
MHNALLGLLLCTATGCTPFALADEDPAASLSVTRQFASQGTIQMQLTTGSYSIRSASTDQIRVIGTADYPGNQKRLRAEVEIRGAEAIIITNGPHNNAHFTIEVPRQSNLMVRLQAGDIRIERIEGNLDITSHAGDVNIEVSRAGDYRSVDASVYAGDLNAPAFGASTGGLFRSLHWSGASAHKLLAHLGAGELNLESAE